MNYPDPNAFESSVTKKDHHRFVPPPLKLLECLKCGYVDAALNKVTVGSLDTCKGCGVYFTKIKPETRHCPGHPLYRGALFDAVKFDDKKSLANIAMVLTVIVILIIGFSKLIIGGN